MARKVDAVCSQHQSGDDSESRFRALLLGLGAGELAAHLARSCAGDVEAVELDGRLPILGQRYFGLPSSVKTTVGDAGPVVSGLAQQVAENQLLADQRRYDTILVDCFSTGGVTPEHCRSEEFVGKLHALLRNGGRVLHHMWHVDANHPQVPTDFSNTIALYRKLFACTGCEVQVQALEGGPDSLIIASYPAGEN
jgi:spermidine synthase